jgi:hypothetical protein
MVRQAAARNLAVYLNEGRADFLFFVGFNSSFGHSVGYFICCSIAEKVGGVIFFICFYD